MEMWKEIARTFFKIAAVVLGLYLLLEYLPFDGRTSDEIAAEDRFKRLRSLISGMPKSRVAFEVAAAMAYAQTCGFEVAEDMPGTVFNAANFAPEEIDLRGGVYKTDVEHAVERVIVATKVDKGEACRLAQSRYGKYGTLLPGMITE